MTKEKSQWLTDHDAADLAVVLSLVLAAAHLVVGVLLAIAAIL